MGESMILSYDLPCPAQQAFKVYVHDIGTWWPRHLSADPATFDGLRIEPWVSGRVFATYAPDVDVEWGTVLSVDPGHRLEHTFSVPHLSAATTTITATFEDHDTGSRLSFRGVTWDGVDALSRSKFGEWPLILGEFVEAARSARRS